MTQLLLKIIDESDKIDDFNCGDDDIMDMKSYYLEKLNLGFEWFRDRKTFSILVIDLFKYEKSIK